MSVVIVTLICGCRSASGLVRRAVLTTTATSMPPSISKTSASVCMRPYPRCEGKSSLRSNLLWTTAALCSLRSSVAPKQEKRGSIWTRSHAVFSCVVVHSLPTLPREAKDAPSSICVLRLACVYIYIRCSQPDTMPLHPLLIIYIMCAKRQRHAQIQSPLHSAFRYLHHAKC